MGDRARTCRRPAIGSCSRRAGRCSCFRRSRAGSSKPRATRASGTARAGGFLTASRCSTLSDESGEVEFWKVPANGVGDATQLTTDGKVLRWDGIPSSDGTHIAHFDKDQQLWVYDIAAQDGTSEIADMREKAISPTSRGRPTASGSPTPPRTRTR